MTRQRQYITLAEAEQPLYVGVDLGGTNTKVGLVDDRGRPLAWQSAKTDPPSGPERGVQRIAELLEEALEDAGVRIEQVAAIGLGTPGTQDLPSGMLLEPPNLPGWENFPIRDRVSAACGGLPVTYANDGLAAAYGEYWVGRGCDFRSMVFFTLGTGVGCGIIVNDMSLDGAHSHGSECGHIIIDYRDDARMCPCGQPGHLEAYASAKAVTARTQEQLDAGRRSSLQARIAQGEPLTPLMVAQEAEAGDELSLEIVLDTAMYVGVGTVCLMHTVDPDGVVLGGAMTFGGHASPLGRRFLERVRQEVHRRAFRVLAEKTEVDLALLGSDAGFVGAAGLARTKYRNGQL